jgi:hypothetical protein
MINIHNFEEDVAFVGPPLTAGSLPILFYFSLSAKESLTLDPFNQPVAYLSELPMRIFSITLPGHEDNLPPTEALNVWAGAISQGRNIVEEFVKKVQSVIHTLEMNGSLHPGKVAVAGLSRGAFMATHAAAAIPQITTLLGFAPLTVLKEAKEFHTLSEYPLVNSLSLEHLTEKLIHKDVRFYIGNLDTRVSTAQCFHFIEKLAQSAHRLGIRSPQAELFIGPSIGKDGHGTSKEVFHDGAQWIAQKLEAIDVV